MLRSQVGELFFITHVGNIGSLLRLGILSHNRAARFAHSKVDLEAVQDIRANIRISPTRMLHDHANLYVCGRNAMMYYVANHNPINEICLLRVSPEVLDIRDVVVSDGNAARRGYTRFRDAVSGIDALDFERIHAQWWTNHEDEAANYEHKRVKQAEVLVPGMIEPRFIVGAYAPTPRAQAAIVAASAGTLEATIAKYPFFRGLPGT